MYLHEYRISDDKGSYMRTFPLKKYMVYRMGSGEDCNIVFVDAFISQRHAELKVGRWFNTLRDLGSSNGTYYRGRPLGNSSRRLPPGTHFYLGKPEQGLLLQFSDDENPEAEIRVTKIWQNTAGDSISVLDARAESGGKILVAKEIKLEIPQQIQLSEIRHSEPQPGSVDTNASRYQPIGTMEWGGTARVDLCRDTTSGTPVIAKIGDRGQMDKIEREYRILSLLYHPHVIECLELTVIPGYPNAAPSSKILVLEFFPGLNWRQYVHKVLENDEWENATYVPNMVRAVLQVVDALIHCHNLGLNHRDVNPLNLMRTDTRSVLIDFGIARFADSTGTMDLPRGTLQYMAPESISKQELLQEIDEKEEKKRLRMQIELAIDSYGLGASFYFALTSRPPLPLDANCNMVMVPTLIATKPREGFADGDLGDAYLRQICLDQIGMDWKTRPTLPQFQTRLQLWWLVYTASARFDFSPLWERWAELFVAAEAVAEDDVLPELPGIDSGKLAKVWPEMRRLLGLAALDDPPPFWSGRRIEPRELTEDQLADCRIFQVPGAESERGRWLGEMRPQVYWGKVLLLPGTAVRVAGPLAEAAIPEVAADDNSPWGRYHRALKCEQCADAEHDPQQKAQLLAEALQGYRQTLVIDGGLVSWLLPHIQGVERQQQLARRIADELARWEEERQHLLNEHAAALADLQEQHRQQLAAVGAEQKAEWQRLQNEHHRKTEDLRQRHSEELVALQNERQRCQEELTTCKEQNRAIYDEFTAILQTLSEEAP